ncbi:hypothetical protein CUT44_17165 [Streptomyces carminius]|uniref:Uncharacterized protein n=1 Tax=Streptomyces carminius TaxID=2665496 RepID=A0A2M8LXT0_9ACTN|nr:hypothetical protein [Streptomyces carminius]PJE96751.1 hypothetical protein CUT44_17165 [Streptomyces carminius]
MSVSVPYGGSPVQLLVVTTSHGAALLAAAADAGLLGPARERLPVVASAAPVPEAVPAPAAPPGAAPPLARFGRVLSWDAVVRPLHPGGWVPRADDAPLWERQLRALWGLGGAGVELVVERVESAPARALARIFPDAPLTVLAPGLSAYGPTPGRLDPLTGTRVRRVLHPDVLPGLRPLLLAEFGTAARAVPATALRAVAAEWARELEPPVPEAGGRAPGEDAFEGCALLLGQDPAAPGALPPAEEGRLYGRMLRRVRELGHRTVVWTPHPAAPAHRVRGLAALAGELGVTLGVPGGVPGGAPPAEALYERLRPALVAGCASGALLTAGALHGLPAARLGTGALLEGMVPYENADRVPAVLVHELLPDLAAGEPAGVVPPGPGETAELAELAELAGLVRAVAYCMWPRVRPELRGEAERFLAACSRDRLRRHFARRRLAALALPGAVPASLAPLARSTTVRRTARRARAVVRAVR